jgi:hypothetical protein
MSILIGLGLGDGSPPPTPTGISLPLLFSSTAIVVTPPDPTPIPTAEEVSYVQIFGGGIGSAVGVSAADSAIGHVESQVFSLTADGPVVNDPYKNLGSSATITTVLYRANRNNTWLEDLSDRVDSGSVSVDTSQATPMTFQGTTIEQGILTPYQDWVAPVMTYRYPDPITGATISTTQQLGLFMVMPPTLTDTAAIGTQSIDGRDALWLLSSSGPGSAYSVAKTTNIGSAIKTICDNLNLRNAIQSTSVVMPKKRTWPWNTSWLQIANDLATMVGFVPMWVDRTGRIRTHRFRKLATIEPARTLSSSAGMILDQVIRQPDLSRLCNQVVVVGNDPKGNPVKRKLINNDPDSETSTVRLGTANNPIVIGKFEEDPNLDDQDAVDQRANLLMDQGTSVFVNMSVTTMPVLDFEIGDVNRLDIQRDDGTVVATGLWRWNRLTIGLGVDATTQWEMSKLIPWSQVA